MTKQTEAMKLALEAAYLAGFNASGEGYNGEYPFRDHAKNPEEDAAWIKDRDNALQKALAEQPAQQEPVAWADLNELTEQFNSVNCGTAYRLPGENRKPLYTSPPASKPLTDEMVVDAARMLSDRQAAACNVDCGDMWKIHGNDFIEDARAALEAAHSIKENA